MEKIFNFTGNYGFPYLSHKKLEEVLDGSAPWIHGLIKKGVLRPHYLGSKPYFSIPEIIEVLEKNTPIKDK